MPVDEPPLATPDPMVLFEENPDPMWVYDLETLRFLAVNQAAIELYGYSRDEFLAMTIAEIRPVEDVAALRANVAAVEPGLSISGGWRHRIKSGALIEVEIRSRPILFGDRAAELVVPRDVTARNRSEAETRRLASIVQSASDAIIGKTLDGTITSWNRGAERLYGYTAQEAIGRHIDLIVPLDKRDELQEIFRRLAADETIDDLVTERLRKDGSRVHVSLRISSLRDASGRLVGASSIGDDITDRVQAHRALSRSERHFRSLIENASDIIAVVTADGALAYASPSAGSSLGYAEGDLIGRSLLELVHPEDVSAAREYLRSERSAAARQLPLEVRFRHGDGRWRVLALRATPLPPDAGGPGMVINATDVTEQRNLEGQLRQAVKMEAVGRLAAGVAHDFNNILTVVAGNVSLALQSTPDSDPRHAFLLEIQAAGERAASFTRQLLTFSRKDLVQMGELDVGAVVEDMSTLLRRVIGEDVILETTIDPALSSVRADRGQLEQVLLNLAVNARDAMPRGGRLCIQVAEVDLDEHYARQHMDVRSGRYVMVAVSDTGIGMDVETQRRIFDPFFTTKDARRGTGLGLSIVYGIVKQMEGSIWVYSELGRGTTMKIYLPARDSGHTATAERSAQTDLVHGEGTILLLEDDEAVRGLVRATLEHAGYQVIVPATPREVEEIFATERRIDVIVTDVVMPGLDPVETARRWQNREPSPVILYISGYTEEVLQPNAGLLLGARTSFLQKPFTPAALTRRVHDLLIADRGSR